VYLGIRPIYIYSSNLQITTETGSEVFSNWGWEDALNLICIKHKLGYLQTSLKLIGKIARQQFTSIESLFEKL